MIDKDREKLIFRATSNHIIAARTTRHMIGYIEDRRDSRAFDVMIMSTTHKNRFVLSDLFNHDGSCTICRVNYEIEHVAMGLIWGPSERWVVNKG